MADPGSAGPVGAARRWAGGLLPGARARRVQIIEHAAAWERRHELALAAEGPLWAVLGDSTAQAIGASGVDHGYVAGTLALLRAQRDPTWRAVNLSVSGARAADVVADQLPRLARLPSPALVSCAVGANDLLRTPSGRLRADLERLADALPAGSLLATVPQGLRRPKAEQVNAEVRRLAAERSLVVVDLWAATGPPWRRRFAADGFHPNDLGYRAWTAAFAAALGLTE